VLDVLKVVRPAHAPLHRHPDSDVD
jgi:hypothetical protein